MKSDKKQVIYIVYRTNHLHGLREVVDVYTSLGYAMGFLSDLINAENTNFNVTKVVKDENEHKLYLYDDCFQIRVTYEVEIRFLVTD